MNATTSPPATATWEERLERAARAQEARMEKIRQGQARLLTIPLMTVGGRVGSARIQVPVPVSFERMGTERPAAGRHVMSVMTEEAGDERYSWESDDLRQIQDARDFYGEMTAKGMIAFRVGRGGKKDPLPMRRFDPRAEEIVFSPINVPKAVVGG